MAAGEGDLDDVGGVEPDEVGPAHAAAARLPRPESRQPSGEPGVGRGEQVAFFLILVVCFVGGSAWLFTKLWSEPWGWLMVLCGLPVYLTGKTLFFRMRGTETAQIAVDDHAVVHVVRGRIAVRRMQRFYDVGPVSWIRSAMVGGILVAVVVLAGLPTVAVVFDAPWVLVVFLTAVAFACLDMVRIVGLHLWPRERRTILDPYVMLPAMALYARHHSYRAAVSGVRADQLLRTLADHRDEWRTGQEYAEVTRAMARMTEPG